MANANEDDKKESNNMVLKNSGMMKEDEKETGEK